VVFELIRTVVGRGTHRRNGHPVCAEPDHPLPSSRPVITNQRQGEQRSGPACGRPRPTQVKALYAIARQQGLDCASARDSNRVERAERDDSSGQCGDRRPHHLAINRHRIIGCCHRREEEYMAKAI